MDTAVPLTTKPLRENWIIVLLGCAVVLVIMNTMMFNLALPAIEAEFRLEPSETSWIVTAYSIVFAIASITNSRLADFVPIRRLFVIGLLSLSVAAIAGYFIRDFVLLILVRVIQASGAGSISGLALVFISRYIPVERRGRAMAAVMSAVSLGLGLGPVVGGAIVQYFGWHFLFLLTAATVLLIPFFARLIPDEKPRAGIFDVAGAALAGIGITALLLALTTRSLTALAAGCAAVLFFILRIRSAPQPFVMPALFAHKAYLALGAVGIVAYMSSFATLFIMPKILIREHHLSAIQAGLVIFPGSLLAMLVSRRVGRIIDSRGNSGIIQSIPFMVLGSTILFALYATRSPFAIMGIYILLSVGFTFLTSSISNEMSRILKPAEIGSGMGLFQLMQFFSGAFGVAISASSLVWQRDFQPETAYGNIFWGMTFLVTLSILAGQVYLRLKARNAQQV